ncbi:unnamed protein product [Calypogeia fissa]
MAKGRPEGAPRRWGRSGGATPHRDATWRGVSSPWPGAISRGVRAGRAAPKCEAQGRAMRQTARARLTQGLTGPAGVTAEQFCGGAGEVCGWSQEVTRPTKIRLSGGLKRDPREALGRGLTGGLQGQLGGRSRRFWEDLLSGGAGLGAHAGLAGASRSPTGGATGYLRGTWGGPGIRVVAGHYKGMPAGVRPRVTHQGV